jgi:phage shock protein PspC (stress-responsive transcriptional regulator)/signal transduction histidine kinase
MQEPSRPPYESRGWHHERHDWHDGHDHWGHDGRWEEWAERLATRTRRWGGAWNGEPLRRDSGDQLAGGVAAGFARWRGRNPTTVRIVLVIAALFTAGWLIPFYFVAWLLVPARDAAVVEPGNSGMPANIWSRARHDSRGITLAAGVASVICVFLLEAGVLNDQVIQTYGWPQVVSAACLVLVWRNAPDSEQAALRRLVAPLGGLGPGAGRRGTVLRLAVACVLLAVGMGWLLSAHARLALLRPLGGFVLILGALVLLLGPWWLRIARDLVLERQARARAEERADMAARVHDSVLQTMALIQRHADDPAQVTQLARAQERELRSWLFEGRAPGSMHEVTSLGAGVRQIQQDAEARHGVPVEVVTVGDCPLDDNLGALLEAAREAVVNAAKWSEASVISLYAEVTAEDVELVVRDRGRGFDPAAVPGDRKGMAESIHGRMGRHGGTVTVQTAIGEGTKVSLNMPRSAVRASS